MSFYKRFSRRLVVVPSLFLIILLIQHVFFKSASVQVLHIQGQWKDVRRSLGLPALSDTIHISAHSPASSSQRLVSSRFFKRSIHLDRDTPELYFSADALEEPMLSYEELLESFHSIALREEIEEERRNMQQAQKQTSRKGKGRKKDTTVGRTTEEKTVSL